MSFIAAVSVKAPRAKDYPFSIPAIRKLGKLRIDPRATFFVGENGSGKSTLVEAIAVAAGLNPEGGSRNFDFSTKISHSALHEAITVEWTQHPRDGYFLRAESFYNVASKIDELDREPGGGAAIIDSYGGKSLHQQSHGESFLALAVNRFGERGLYVLDEPEAALSIRGQLALLARMHDLAAAGSQFLVATHSPILTAFPGARIYELDEDGIRSVAYDETDPVDLTRSFLASPERFLRHLLAE